MSGRGTSPAADDVAQSRPHFIKRRRKPFGHNRERERERKKKNGNPKQIKTKTEPNETSRSLSRHVLRRPAADRRRDDGSSFSSSSSSSLIVVVVVSGGGGGGAVVEKKNETLSATEKETAIVSRSVMDEVEGGWFEPPISNKKKTAFLFYPEPLTKIKKKKNEETDFQNHVQWRWDLLVPFQPPKKKTNEKETKMKESNPPPTDNGRRFFFIHLLPRRRCSLGRHRTEG